MGGQNVDEMWMFIDHAYISVANAQVNILMNKSVIVLMATTVRNSVDPED